LRRDHLKDLAKVICQKGPVKIADASGRRVRIVFDNQFIADTTRACFVWEKPYYPYFYVPLKDVDPAILHENDIETVKDVNQVLALIRTYPRSKSVTSDRRMMHFLEIQSSVSEELKGMVRFEFKEMG
jgi:Domain of unknown function (DUF427)